MEWLQSLDNDTAVLLRVRAQPGAARTAIRGEYGDTLKIAVAAPPADGRANAALIAFLAKVFGLPRSAVTLVAGVGSRDKRFHLLKISRAAALAKLLPLLP